MSTTIRARFANGVLEPLEDLRLNEGDEVVVRIEPLASAPGLAWLEETAGGWKGLIDADELKRRIAGGADIGFYVGDQATRPNPSVRQLSRPCAYVQENVYATRGNGKQAGRG